MIFQNIASIDIGTKNSAIAVWKRRKLIYFEKFSVENIKSLIESMNKYKKYFKTSSHIFIEQQMRVNHKAVIIEAQMYMWFAINCPKVTVELFSARKKYKNLDATIYNTKSKRKKWVVEYIQIYLPDNLKILFNELEKKDDVADAIIIGQMMLEQ